MGLDLGNWLEESGKDCNFSKKQQVESDFVKMTVDWKKSSAYSLPKYMLFGAVETEDFDAKGCSLLFFMLYHHIQQY